MIYFARPIGRETPIKIGCATNPSGRLYDLRWRGRKCELLATMGGDFALEGQFHALFADWHEGGEWFTANAALLNAIDSINRFQSLMESLPKGRRLTDCGRHYKTQIGRLAEIAA